MICEPTGWVGLSKQRFKFHVGMNGIGLSLTLCYALSPFLLSLLLFLVEVIAFGAAFDCLSLLAFDCC